MHRTEKAASKVMGTAKEAKAVLSSVTGVFKELMREHGEVTALLLRVKASSDAEVRSDYSQNPRRARVAREGRARGGVSRVPQA